MEITADARLLARCNGFLVATDGQIVGAVATPVFSGTNLAPDYLLVRLASARSGSYRVVSPELIAAVDEETETVLLAIPRDDVSELPEADGPTVLPALRLPGRD